MSGLTIRRGGVLLTGKWSDSYWFVVVPKGLNQKFRLLFDAQVYAISQGASGEWNRTLDPIGPRGRKCVVYRDAKATGETK